MKRKFSILLIGLLLTALLFGCGKKPVENEPAVENEKPAAPAQTPAVEPEADAPADTALFPEFVAYDLQGREVSSAEFSEYDLTVVNIWATWCGPCVGELPYLAKLESAFPDANVRVLGILMEDGADAADAAALLLEDAGAAYTVFQPEGELLLYLYQNIMYFPTTFLVDRNGQIVGEPLIGARDMNGWTDTVQNALVG